MTVKKLKMLLEDCSDNLEVFIRKTNDDYELSLLGEVKEERAKFSDGSLKAYDYVIVLEDI